MKESVEGGAMADWIGQMYQEIDKCNVDGFVAYLDKNIVMRFGNAEPMAGPGAIRKNIGDFFNQLKGLRHEFVGRWQQEDIVVLEANVTYIRKDDKVVKVPAATVLRVKDKKVLELRVYVDLTPLYA